MICLVVCCLFSRHFQIRAVVDTSHCLVTLLSFMLAAAYDDKRGAD